MEYIKSRRITISIMMRKDDEEAANGDEMGLDSGCAARDPSNHTFSENP